MLRARPGEPLKQSRPRPLPPSARASARSADGGSPIMARKKTDAELAVSQARIHAKEIRKKSKLLLKRAKIDVREYRKELSTLKKQGIVAKRINAARHNATRYMLRKVKKFKGVATGKELAVPISRMSPHRARQYIEKGTAKREGKFLIVPKTAARQRLDIIKGHLATYTKLGQGEERVIFLPYEAKDLNEFIEQLKNHESEINSLKEPTEQFGFQLYGHNARKGFPSVNGDIHGLLHYLENNYQTILSSPRKSRNAFQHFVLIRFKNKIGLPQMGPYSGVKYYDRKHRKNDPYYQRELRKRQTSRKQLQRKKETPEQKAKRLTLQRIRDNKRSNDRREKRMAERLLGK
jgi:hypothetical protein